MSTFLIMTQCDNGAAYAEVDQFTQTEAAARREARDLSHMGCGPVRIYEFPTEEEAQNYADEKDAKYPAKSAARLVATIA